MKNTVVARNYASAVLALAREADAVDHFGDLLDAVAGAVAATPSVKAVLMSPRVRKDAKQQVLAKALKGVAPEAFVRFLQAVVRRGRQGILSDISAAYGELADQHFNRVHASVTTARAVDAKLAKEIGERLERAMGKTVLQHFHVDPLVVGGVVVRVGDRVFDGSIRRRLMSLRRAMLTTRGAGT
ncbi:MAG: ATP synthase F1 subunit delta [Gemmatimonadales bacterium]